MRQSRPLYLALIGIVLLLLAVTIAPSFASLNLVAHAQDVPPAAETTVPPPDTATPTSTPTSTPTATSTGEPTATPTNTGEPTATPTATDEGEPEPPAPVQIPEPITVVLFGTGLAALSAAAASRRKNDGE